MSTQRIVGIIAAVASGGLGAYAVAAHPVPAWAIGIMAGVGVLAALFPVSAFGGEK